MSDEKPVSFKYTGFPVFGFFEFFMIGNRQKQLNMDILWFSKPTVTPLMPSKGWIWDVAGEKTIEIGGLVKTCKLIKNGHLFAENQLCFEKSRWIAYNVQDVWIIEAWIIETDVFEVFLDFILHANMVKR